MVNINNRYTSEGELIFKDGILFETEPKTMRGIELETYGDWEPINESWISYRVRTAEARRVEELKRYEIARRKAAIYNTNKSEITRTGAGQDPGFL